jgi:predicted transcriptional regulator
MIYFLFLNVDSNCIVLQYNMMQYNLSHKTMSKENITFRIDSDQKAALDAIAAGINRDRCYVLNQAVAAYVEMYQWQLEEIQKGIAEADVGDFASDEEVKATFAKLTNAG